MTENSELIKSFNRLKKNLKKDFGTFKKIRVAVIGDSSTQFLVQALRGFGFEENFDFDILEADYNQVEQQILDVSSGLYEFKPEFVIIFQSVQKLQKKFYKIPLGQKSEFCDKHIDEVENFYNVLTSQLNTKIIYFNFLEINDSVFGNFANKTSNSFLYQVRKINYRLMEVSQTRKNLFICDFSALNLRHGLASTFDAKMYYTSDMVLSFEILPWIAKNITDIISSITGNFKKCIIIDLDNTMWGGIIGDDGIENIQIGDLGIGKAFVELQAWFKQLKERGIILAVCSKNNEATAKEPFEKHPDMVLRLDDISVFIANWDNKADNIKQIQSILNIGFDSMVFLDDNPFERSMVKTHIPGICVPDLPEDPALYLEYLLQLNLFETAAISEGDQNRTRQYQEEAERFITQQKFTNEDDFLASLGMTSEIRQFDKFNTPRVAQLSQRSNQFNLRTIRYTEQDIDEMCQSPKHITATFDLKDKFGDNGLICAIILEKREPALFIDTWFMSCRVLKRGMENFTLNTIVEAASKEGYTKIIGEYIPTQKNTMVKDHYEKLGFINENDQWVLDVTSYENKKCFITSK